METLSFDSHGTRCDGTWWPADDDALTGRAGAPCVVMAHGFGATRDSGLTPFAATFAALGAHVLAFDYRGFGTSATAPGAPRQDVDHRRHREDYHAALAAVRARPDVDPDRVAVWGSSYSGGHVVVVAAQDPRVRAVVSQGAAMDGLKALLDTARGGGDGKALRMARAAVRDLARAATRREPHHVPVVGAAGSDAVIDAPGAEEGYRAIVGPTFRNEMCARGVLRVAANRPVRHASRVGCPVLLVAAEHDNVAPVSAVHEVARRLGGRAEVLSLDCGHFDVYVGEVLTTSLARQTAFLGAALALPR